MEIKANSWYRTRGGEIAFAAGIIPESRTYQAVGCDKGDVKSWTLCGRYIEDDVDGRDLVEHLPDCDSFDWKPKPKIQLEAGKKYVLANGDVSDPLTLINDREFCFYDKTSGNLWNCEGVRFIYDARATENIVSEYVEPTPTYVPWDFDTMPDFVRVKSKDNDKRWAAFPISDTLCQRGTLWCEYKQLFDGYTQLDGKPCGRVKQ